jgi:hypothetical protein
MGRAQAETAFCKLALPELIVIAQGGLARCQGRRCARGWSNAAKRRWSKCSLSVAATDGWTLRSARLSEHLCASFRPASDSIPLRKHFPTGLAVYLRKGDCRIAPALY